jgi:hypothetical protein
MTTIWSILRSLGLLHGLVYRYHTAGLALVNGYMAFKGWQGIQKSRNLSHLFCEK